MGRGGYQNGVYCIMGMTSYNVCENTTQYLHSRYSIRISGNWFKHCYWKFKLEIEWGEEIGLNKSAISSGQGCLWNYTVVLSTLANCVSFVEYLVFQWFSKFQRVSESPGRFIKTQIDALPCHFWNSVHICVLPSPHPECVKSCLLPRVKNWKISL